MDVTQEVESTYYRFKLNYKYLSMRMVYIMYVLQLMFRRFVSFLNFSIGWLFVFFLVLSL